MNPFELQKERLLEFADDPADQVDRAYSLLSELNKFHVEKNHSGKALLIKYSVENYSLEGLERALINEGFSFRYSLLGRMKQTLIHYCEDVQYHNLKSAEPRTKNNSQEVFVKAYEQHQHGDHDNTRAPEPRKSS
jgi:hypothetical protein